MRLPLHKRSAAVGSKRLLDVRLPTILHVHITLAVLEVQLELTAVYRKVPEGFVAFVEELPGANSQGETLDEARRNLREAVALVLEANRTLSAEQLAGTDVIREPLKLTA